MFNRFSRFLLSGQGDDSVGFLDPNDRLSILVHSKFHAQPVIGRQKEAYLLTLKKPFKICELQPIVKMVVFFSYKGKNSINIQLLQDSENVPIHVFATKCIKNSEPQSIGRGWKKSYKLGCFISAGCFPDRCML